MFQESERALGEGAEQLVVLALSVKSLHEAEAHLLDAAEVGLDCPAA